MNIREKIIDRLDNLEILLNEGKHLHSDGKLVVDILIESIGKFWTILSSQDRDFLNAARSAVRDGLPWK